MSRGLACVKCRVFLIPKKSGVAVEEGMPLSNKPNGPWGPYKLWYADLAECPICGFQLITGFGNRPLAEHFQANYAEKVAAFSPMVRIDACIGYKP